MELLAVMVMLEAWVDMMVGSEVEKPGQVAPSGWLQLQLLYYLLATVAVELGLAVRVPALFCSVPVSSIFADSTSA